MLDAVWPLYLVLFLAITPWAASPAQSLYRRVTICCLGLAVMFFGTARLLHWSAPAKLASFEWIFTVAHWTLVAFVTLTLHATNHYRKHGKWL